MIGTFVLRIGDKTIGILGASPGVKGVIYAAQVTVLTPIRAAVNLALGAPR